MTSLNQFQIHINIMIVGCTINSKIVLKYHDPIVMNIAFATNFACRGQPD